MSKKAAEHHTKASEHHTQAAKHHSEAAKHHEAGHHEKRRLTMLTPRRVSVRTRAPTPRKPQKRISKTTGRSDRFPNEGSPSWRLLLFLTSSRAIADGRGQKDFPSRWSRLDWNIHALRRWPGLFCLETTGCQKRRRRKTAASPCPARCSGSIRASRRRVALSSRRAGLTRGLPRGRMLRSHWCADCEVICMVASGRRSCASPSSKSSPVPCQGAA
jgi:hypothetical protein